MIVSRAAHPVPAVIPLLAWRELAELDALRAEHRSLLGRIESLRPCSHRRVVLQAKLEHLTARILAAELALKGGRP